MFLFSLPLFPLMQPPPSTRIGYRKTKLLYLFSHGKPAKEKLICSCTMALLILSSSPHSFSCSPVPSFSLFSSLFLAGWKSQSKCNERGRGKRWRQKIIRVLSDESKRNPHGWAGNRHGLAATSTASLYLPELQPFISLRRKLSAHYTSSHAGGGGRPVRRAPNGYGSGPDWGSQKTFIRKL